jgi:hypothetical protein
VSTVELQPKAPPFGRLLLDLILPRVDLVVLIRVEAVEVVEWPFGVNRCIIEGRACGERAPCVVHGAWEEGQSTILEYLGAQTLDEFVAGTASGKLFTQTLPEDRPPSTG